MVQYLKDKQALQVKRATTTFFIVFGITVLTGLGGLLFSKQTYSFFLFFIAGFFALISVLSLVSVLIQKTGSPDKNFQRDLGDIHGNPEKEKAFEADLRRAHNLQLDCALLTDNWLIYENRRGARRALPVTSILWVYRYDQGKTDNPHVSHDLLVMTSARESHEIRFTSARNLTEFITALHRLLPWIFYGYSKQTSRGFNQNFDILQKEVQEARRLYLLDHPNFHPTLWEPPIRPPRHNV